MSDRILRRPEVERAIGLSASTLYKMMEDGLFPRPLRIGRRAVGWPESVVRNWIESRNSAS
ncbi:MAG: helix-turn-helix transcriptional regulator [Albimonas sp.]|uniref:helix-turn-helix transcriptional regulator n=1 Tax=Albimonas sp. TaxID=1872425 RepID=UPI00405661F9